MFRKIPVTFSIVFFLVATLYADVVTTDYLVEHLIQEEPGLAFSVVDNVAVDPFDPALGTLTGVTISTQIAWEVQTLNPLFQNPLSPTPLIALLNVQHGLVWGAGNGFVAPAHTGLIPVPSLGFYHREGTFGYDVTIQDDQETVPFTIENSWSQTDIQASLTGSLESFIDADNTPISFSALMVSQLEPFAPGSFTSGFSGVVSISYDYDPLQEVPESSPLFPAIAGLCFLLGAGFLTKRAR